MAAAIVPYLLGLVILYWVVRFAVAHGTGDALRRERLLHEDVSQDDRIRVRT